MMVTASLFSPQLWGRSANAVGHKTTTARSNRTLTITLLFALHLATLARASVILTNDEYVLRPNEPYTINWQGNRGPVTLTLMNGPDIDLQTVMVIASGLSGTKYTWTPPQTLKTDGYELQIEDGSSVDYSPRFQFPAPPEPSSSSTISSTKPTSTSPSTSTTELSSSSTSSSTATATSTPSPAPSPGLSTGAIAGIAVGASIGGLLLLGLLGWFIYRQGKKAAKTTDDHIMAEGVSAGGYYGPGGSDRYFDQDTVVGGSSVAGFKTATPGTSTWGARATTPFAELGQPEYMPRELWAGGPGLPEGEIQHPLPLHPGQEGDKVAGIHERAYQVPPPVPGVLPGYDENLQTQQDRVADDWHGVMISPASRSGTGIPSVSGFGASPSSETSSPPMGYSATVTTGVPPSTPPMGLGEVPFGRGGSPMSFSSRQYATQASGDEIHQAGAIYQGGNAYGRGTAY